MISERLKTYLIGQFKEQETALLLRAIEWKNKNENKTRYLMQAIMTDVGGMMTVKFGTEENIFIELKTEVVNSKGKSKIETILLSEPVNG